LRNSLRSLHSAFLTLFERNIASFTCFPTGIRRFTTSFGSFRRQRGHLSSTGCLSNGFLQVKSHGAEEKLQRDLGPSETPRAVNPIAALEGAEGSLDFRADAADLTVGDFFRGSQLRVASGLVHDAIGKTSNLKHIAIEGHVRQRGVNSGVLEAAIGQVALGGV